MTVKVVDPKTASVIASTFSFSKQQMEAGNFTVQFSTPTSFTYSSTTSSSSSSSSASSSSTFHSSNENVSMIPLKLDGANNTSSRLGDSMHPDIFVHPHWRQFEKTHQVELILTGVFILTVGIIGTTANSLVIAVFTK